ncbi:Toprim domain-containing protein [Actinocrispum wychmicini]|uniref:Toprim domain-containing protein n=1 Tax=Actinocrispum wychmicini TaxID=1213861 RepID=A0A4R2JBB5_9PSEU|nr:Toprim domain-containing protein [Actinocrispum wychmicini]
MARLSPARRKSLAEATSRYHAALAGSPADEHLANRGLLGPSVAELTAKFRLGYVADPLPGHEPYRGMLAIPYLRSTLDGQWSVATMRFRCLRVGCEHTDHGKYMSLPGDPPRLFNTLAIVGNDDEIGIAEGEIDAITATLCGIPTIGIPGADAWRPHFREPLLGYARVWVWHDGDKAGRMFAHKLLAELPNATAVGMPDGQDVNSLVVSHGRAALRERMT